MTRNRQARRAVRRSSNKQDEPAAHSLGTRPQNAVAQRKTMQLCRQVEQTLCLVLSGECKDELLQSLLVESVTPHAERVPAIGDGPPNGRRRACSHSRNPRSLGSSDGPTSVRRGHIGNKEARPKAAISRVLNAAWVGCVGFEQRRNSSFFGHRVFRHSSLISRGLRQRGAVQLAYRPAIDGQNLRICQGIPKAFEVTKLPDDLFVPSDFHKLRILWPRVAVADHNIPAV